MDKVFYSVGDIASEIGESPSLVRFWSNKFGKFIKPSRNAKGDRLFSPEDLALFKKIHYLVKDMGLTLDGASRRLSAEKKTGADPSETGRLDASVKIKEKLSDIRAQLERVRELL